MEMTQDLSDFLIYSFLSLPDEVLLTEIFPRFPVDIINKLCSANVKFNNICQNDTL